ncbi:MAG: TRAP transporter small permease [Proteobacteria bacterium]|nr:TRAP transporter small permease [Pseudomonadota bacterium]
MSVHRTRSDDTVSRMLRALGAAELAVAAAAFLFTCTIVSLNAGLRYLANSSIIWSEEAALLATNIFVFVGAAVIFKARADVAVSYFLEKMSSRTAAWMEFATFAAAAIFLGVMAVQAILLWPLQRFTSTFILDISRFWFTVPLIWGTASMCLTSLVFAARRFAANGRGRFERLPPFVAAPVEPE